MSMNDYRIAIVDDDESMREAAINLFRSMGFTAAAFASAEDFLSSDQVEGTSCLVLDVQMPGMGGLKLQEHLTATGRRIPIVFITGNADVGDEFQAAKAGAVDFLRKPVSPNILADAIQTALRLHFDGGTQAPDLPLRE